MKKLKIGWMLEGSISGAWHRNLFGEKMKRLLNFAELMTFVTHKHGCVFYAPTPGECDCGLIALLTDVPADLTK